MLVTVFAHVASMKKSATDNTWYKFSQWLLKNDYLMNNYYVNSITPTIDRSFFCWFEENPKYRWNLFNSESTKHYLFHLLKKKNRK